MSVAKSATLQAWLNDPQFRAAWEGFCDDLAGQAREVADGEIPSVLDLEQAILRVLDVVEQRAAHLQIVTEH